MKKKMHLFAYLKTGPTSLHPGGWRHPEATVQDIFSPSRYQSIAQTLEDACFDGCFFADLQGLYDVHGGSFESYIKYGGQISYLDPMTVLPIMAATTRHLGLGATLSTTLLPAYQIARSLLSLDLLSGGRVAWNIVTSATTLEAQNFGIDVLPDKNQRYDMADEVVEACMALWNSWDRDPFEMDKENGIFADPDKVHYANYRGRFIKTRGPLSIPRSSQDHPVLMQAGSSPRGVEFGARWAELIFAIPAAKDIARKNYDTLKAAMVARGRTPEDCAVAMQATCIVGETDSIAREKAAFVNQLARHELTRATLSANSGIDVSRIGSTTGPVEGPAGNQGMHAAINEVSQMARSGMLMDNTKQPSAYLPKQIVGSPTTVADALEDLFVSGCCDGFVLTPVTFPSSHEAFARSVVPELQRRGLFRTRYEGTTLRENLGTRPGW